jgi:signal transduction histidine kinase
MTTVTPESLVVTAAASTTLGLPAGLLVWAEALAALTEPNRRHLLAAYEQAAGDSASAEFQVGAAVLELSFEPSPPGLLLVQEITDEAATRRLLDLVVSTVGKLGTDEYDTTFTMMFDHLAAIFGSDAELLVGAERYGDHDHIYLVLASGRADDALVQLLETSPRASTIAPLLSVSPSPPLTALHADPFFAGYGYPTVWVAASQHIPVWQLLLFREHTELLSWHQQELARISAVFEEFTRVNSALLAVRRERNRWLRRFRLTPTPSVLTDDAGTMIELNDAFAELLGLDATARGALWGMYFDTGVDELPTDGTPLLVTFTTSTARPGVGRVAAVRLGVGRLLVEVADVTAEQQFRRRVDQLNAELAANAELLARQGATRRLHTATVLHNDVLQRLAAMRMLCEASTAPAPDVLVHHLDELTDTIRTHLVELRVASALDAGFDAAITGLVEQARRTGLDVDVTLEPIWLRPATEELLYRAAQELLRNVVVHASATRCWITVTDGDRMVHLTVTDNGVGAAFIPGLDQRHFGLFMLDEAVAAASGSLEMRSDQSGGVTVTIEIPLHPDEIPHR